MQCTEKHTIVNTFVNLSEKFTQFFVEVFSGMGEVNGDEFFIGVYRVGGPIFYIIGFKME